MKEQRTKLEQRFRDRAASALNDYRKRSRKLTSVTEAVKMHGEGLAYGRYIAWAHAANILMRERWMEEINSASQESIDKNVARGQDAWAEYDREANEGNSHS